MSFFNHPEVVKLINEYGQDLVIRRMGDLMLYINEPENYELILDEDIRVISRRKEVNPGVKYMDNSFFSEIIRFEQFDLDDPRSQNGRMTLVKYFDEDKSAFIHGANGVGKTTFTIALCNIYHNKRGNEYLYVSWPDYIDKVKDFQNKPASLGKVKNAKALIIDDLGNENITKFSRDGILFSIINYRLERKLQTFIISNYSPEELCQRYMLERNDSKVVTTLHSKIMGLCHPIQFNGVNYRNEE